MDLKAPNVFIQDQKLHMKSTKSVIASFHQRDYLASVIIREEPKLLFQPAQKGRLFLMVDRTSCSSLFDTFQMLAISRLPHPAALWTGEWSPYPEIFQDLYHRWGMQYVDLLAARQQNRQVFLQVQESSSGSLECSGSFVGSVHPDLWLSMNFFVCFSGLKWRTFWWSSGWLRLCHPGKTFLSCPDWSNPSAPRTYLPSYFTVSSFKHGC